MSNNLIFLVATGFVVGAAYYCQRQGKAVLFAWVALQGILANLFVLKQITLFGLNATASDVFAVGALLGLNLLQTSHGRAAAKQAIFASFLCMIFFCVVSQMHLLYTPSDADYMHDAYQAILQPAPRILIASLLTFFLVQHFDVQFFALLGRFLPKASFTLRATVSLLISQALDTVLFSCLALYQQVEALLEVMLISYTIKTLIIMVMMPVYHVSQQLNENPS